MLLSGILLAFLVGFLLLRTSELVCEWAITLTLYEEHVPQGVLRILVSALREVIVV